MTTIAYNHKDKEIAADSQSTSGYTISSQNVTKLHRLDYGWFAFSGDLADAYILIDYLSGNISAESLDLSKLEVGGFILPDKGQPYKIYISNTGHVVKIECNHSWGLGSGREYALGALHCGASAKDAVNAAIKYDIYSSGKILVKKKGQLK